MIKPAHKTLKKALVLLCSVLVLISISAFRAYRISDKYIQEGIPVPFYRIEFVLHPNQYIDGARELGFKPGWVVTYAPRSKNYGTALFVTLLGSILTSGTPAIVTEKRQQAQNDIEKFQKAFAQVDAAVQVGMTYSNAASLLKNPTVISTNDDRTVDAFYSFWPDALVHVKVDSLTNGFTLRISNNIVIQKTYSFTSSR